VPEPTLPGNFLRTNTGTWEAGLPLTGGTLTGPGNLTTSGFVTIGNPATDPTGSIRLTPGSDMLMMPVLRVSDGPGLNQLGQWGWNGLVVGVPTGPPVFAPGSINTPGGYFVNGVSIGTPPFLPLAGGTLTAPGWLSVNELRLDPTMNDWRISYDINGLTVNPSWTSFPFLRVGPGGVVTIGNATAGAMGGGGNLNISGDYFRNGVNIFAPLHLPTYNNLLPQPGDIWWDGTNLNFQTATTTVTLA
jgi:hypothetical protein